MTRTLAILALIATVAVANGNVFMQGFYSNVLSPSDSNNHSTVWWYDRLGGLGNYMRSQGFTGIWIPCALKGASGNQSSGYDPFDDYDIGSKNQKGSVSTRFGTREQLERMCAMFRANNLDIYEDIVDNHRDGDPGNWKFTYVNAFGQASGGRFSKSYYDFHPNVPQDPNVPDGNNEFSFGRDLAPINGEGHYVYTNLMAAGDWLTSALDLQGYRLDDVKGISTDWLYPFLNYRYLKGKFAVGEFYDTNLSKVQGWISQMQGRSSAFDFPLRGSLKTMCNNPGSFDMSTLDHAGLAGVDPYHAVTFVENHDTDGSDPITQNKMLAYAYILTSEGYPCVFYKDWSTDSNCYKLRDPIDNLVYIHEHLASGTTQQRWKNNLVFVFERMGGKHLLVGLNNNTGFDYKLYSLQTGFGPGVRLRDYTGHCPDIYTDAKGTVNIDLPPAINGMGYCCYAPYASFPPFTNPISSTTQLYVGAADLDIRPADNMGLTQVCRIYCLAGKTIKGLIDFDKTGWTSKTSGYLELDDPSGSKVASNSFTLNSAQWTGATFTAAKTGLYTWKVRAFNTPAVNLKPSYWLSTTYYAPQTFQ